MTRADLKVVILNDSSIAKGGATGLALLSAQLLRDRRIDTTFIAGDAGDNGVLAAKGVELVAMGGKLLLDQSKLKTVRNGLYNKDIKDRVAAYIAEHDTPGTVYHLHGWSRILSPAIFDALKPVATRTFIHAHDFFLACPNGAFYDFRKSEICTRKPLSGSCLATACDRRSYHHKLWRYARSGVARRAFDQNIAWAGVLTLHDKMIGPLSRADIPKDRIKTVPNPARAFTTSRIKAEENKDFCFIGRVETGKGIGMLCEAATRANVPLRVIGDGAELATLQAKFPNITFHGWVDQNEIGRYLDGVRALVMPSRTPEPFGLVAAEASFSGLPVILSNYALIADDVMTRGLGFATDTNVADSLAASLTHVANLPAAEIQRISKAGYAATNTIALTPDAWINALLSHYREAI